MALRRRGGEGLRRGEGPRLTAAYSCLQLQLAALTAADCYSCHRCSLQLAGRTAADGYSYRCSSYSSYSSYSTALFGPGSAIVWPSLSLCRGPRPAKRGTRSTKEMTQPLPLLYLPSLWCRGTCSTKEMTKAAASAHGGRDKTALSLVGRHLQQHVPGRGAERVGVDASARPADTTRRGEQGYYH